MARFSPCIVSCLCGDVWQAKSYYRAVFSIDHHLKECECLKTILKPSNAISANLTKRGVSENLRSTLLARMYQNQKGETIVPLPKPKGARSTGGMLPTPELSGDFDPFLKAEHIGKGKLGDTATLVFTGKNVIDDDNEYGARLQCQVRLDGDLFCYGVKFESGSYGRLFKRFGSNPKKWKGKVKVEVMKHMKKLYVAVI